MLILVLTLHVNVFKMLDLKCLDVLDLLGTWILLATEETAGESMSTEPANVSAQAASPAKMQICDKCRSRIYVHNRFIIYIMISNDQQFVATPFPFLIRLPLSRTLAPFPLLQSIDHDMKNTIKNL